MRSGIKLLLLNWFFIFSFFIVPQKSMAGGSGWEDVGSAINSGIGSFTGIVFDELTNTPYIAFDRTSDFKLVVMKLVGNDWVNVGTPGFTNNAVNNISLVLNPETKEPYVAFSQSGDLGISVMKFDGSSWIFVGNENFFSGPGSGGAGPSIAFDLALNEPYISFKDTNNSGKLSVMKFNGSNWSIVGSAGVSSGAIDYSKIVFNPSDNKPYVAFRDEANFGKITVMNFNGSSWVNIGNAGFSDGSSFDIALAFNPLTHNPCVGYYSTLGSVMCFNGDTWNYVGSQGFLDGGINGVQNTQIAFNLITNELYVTYTEGTVGLSVKKFDGIDWVFVGSEHFTPGEADFVSFAFDASGSVPYVFFKGVYINGGEVYRPIIMKLALLDDFVAPSAPLGLGVI